MIQIGRFVFWVVVAVQLLLTDFVLLVYFWVTFSFGRPNFWQSLLHMNQGPSSLSPVQFLQSGIEAKAEAQKVAKRRCGADSSAC